MSGSATLTYAPPELSCVSEKRTSADFNAKQYGLKLMYELALKYGAQPVFLKDIANAHGISEKYLSKLVIPLRGVALISSFRGAHGGYALARDPRKITVREIVQVLEGEIAPATGSRSAEPGNRRIRTPRRACGPSWIKPYMRHWKT